MTHKYFRQNTYEIVGGSGGQVMSALSYAAIVSHMKAEALSGSVPQELDLEPYEESAYRAALGFLERMWRSEPAQPTGMLVGTKVSGVEDFDPGDVIERSISLACDKHVANRGRMGMFTLSDFCDAMAGLANIPEVSVFLCKSILDSRAGIDSVDSGLYCSRRLVN